MLLQQTKSKSSPRRLPCRSHHNGHHNHDTKFDVTDTRVNLELLFHTTEDIPWKKFMEMGLVEGEAPTRVIASFFQTSRELWCWHSKYQQPSLKGKAQNDIPRLIPSLLRVISANYFFFSLSSSSGTMTKKSLLSVRSSNRMTASTRFFKK